MLTVTPTLQERVSRLVSVLTLRLSELTQLKHWGWVRVREALRILVVVLSVVMGLELALGSGALSEVTRLVDMIGLILCVELNLVYVVVMSLAVRVSACLWLLLRCTTMMILRE